MSVNEKQDLATYCTSIAERARHASRALCNLQGLVKNRWLMECASELESRHGDILQANAMDLNHAPKVGLTDAETDRLRLTPARLHSIADALRQIAALPDPVGELIEGSTRPNGLRISKVRVPLGVIFFIYESRPNVTADAAGIAVKSGNAIILRGGKESIHSSTAIVEVIQQVADRVGVPRDAVQLVNTIDREAVGHLLKLDQYIDLAIPRGGEGLIRRVVAEATMPVLKHFDGNCHIYVDPSADLELAARVIENSKCQRMGVCNTLESLVIHRSIAAQALPMIQARMDHFNIEYRCDDEALKLIPSGIPATSEDWSKEYLGPVVSVRIVGSLQEAIDHINRYSSKHTDGIIARDVQSIQLFSTLVDSAAVVVNASTRFNDGGELGMGAEIGISTDKFHARGPCGLRELTTYKYIVHGDGHVRI
jgi:glutamate-5-semialdehyde dehydrogenase